MTPVRVAKPLVALLVCVATAGFMIGSAARAEDSPMPHTHGSEPGEGKLNVAVLLYPGVLLLDYGIAAEMFLAADFMRTFDVYTVSRTPDVSVSILGTVRASFGYSEAPRPDIVIVPGGPTWLEESAEEETQAFLRGATEAGSLLYSICSGAMLLGKLGFLDGHTVTTVHQGVPMLRKVAPNATVVDDRNYVDDGSVVTAAGSGTAIEATLHVIERFAGSAIAETLGRRYMDYPHMGD